MAARTYYELLFRLGGRLGWLLWFSDHVDAVDVLDGRFRVFATAPALADDARLRGIEIVAEEPILHDLDMIASWLARPQADSIDPAEFLAGWNLFADVASSLGRLLEDRTIPYRVLYDKLFLWGGPAWVTGREHREQAVWTPEEVVLLADVLGRGLGIFTARMVAVGSQSLPP